MGTIRLTGRLHEPVGGSKGLLVLVHGLGGSHESPYMMRAARVAVAEGISCLRLNLRGADRNGIDFYHAGLTVDIREALKDHQLAHFERIMIMGWSLGGHVTLRYAGEAGRDPSLKDPRVTSVAAVCAPIDLRAGALKIDRPKAAFYRHQVLGGLKDIYAGVARNRPVPIPVREALAIQHIRTWDDLVVAPRFGFDGAEGYWADASVIPWLEHIDVPALLVVTRYDPMVIADDVMPHVSHLPHLTTALTNRGGHVGFPRPIRLGLSDRLLPGSAELQMLRWLRAQ